MGVHACIAQAQDGPGEYVVSSCKVGSTPTLAAGWLSELRHSTGGARGAFDDCAKGGSFGIDYSSVSIDDPNHTIGFWRVTHRRGR